MYTVKLLREAELDIADASEWYEKQQKGLAKRFLKELNQYLRSIGKNPNKFNIRFSGKFRFAALKIFPYLIVYSVDANNKTIYVNTIFHTSRDPKNL